MFDDILERKKAFSKKSRKVVIFSKGLVNGFGQIIENLQSFSFWKKIARENVVNDTLERKQSLLDYKNKELNKSKNWDFSKGISPWFWSKN